MNWKAREIKIYLRGHTCDFSLVRYCFKFFFHKLYWVDEEYEIGIGEVWLSLFKTNLESG